MLTLDFFAFAKFYYKLYIFGHHLDPKAPVTVEPFTPVIVGTKQIANFLTKSYPSMGSFFLLSFILSLLGLLVLGGFSHWKSLKSSFSENKRLRSKTD